MKLRDVVILMAVLSAGWLFGTYVLAPAALNMIDSACPSTLTTIAKDQSRVGG